MFSLRIHSVDTHHLLTLTSAHTGGVTTIAVLPNPNPKIQECRGIVHLYRHLSHHSTSPQSTSQASTLLFLLAVPSHFSSDDFLRFCGSHIDHVTEVVLIRNDAMEDRYSVLMKFVDQERAQSFYRNFNGRRFSSTEAEVCHILFTVSVEYTEVTEFASTPPPGCTELPTCPVCLERLDQDTSGILTTLCDHSFQCPCISKWTDSFCSIEGRQKTPKPRAANLGTTIPGACWTCRSITHQARDCPGTRKKPLGSITHQARDRGLQFLRLFSSMLNHSSQLRSTYIQHKEDPLIF